MIDYDEDTISAIEQDYSNGEYSNLDSDPEMEGRRKARERQEELDKQTQQRKANRRLAEAAFIPGGLPAANTVLRSEAELNLAGFAQSVGYDAARFCGPLGPMAIPCVRNDTALYKPLIEAWERDPAGYLAELKRRGLVR